MEGTEPFRILRFGMFELDLQARALRRSGVKIKLQEQPFQVLAALLERPAQLVSREELHRRLWADDTFVDFDNSLNAAVNRLRETLGDSAENPRFIETVPRRGYRFIAHIGELHWTASSSEPKLESVPAAANGRAGWNGRLAVLTGALLVVFAASYFTWRRYHAPTLPPGERIMLAVLPFENLTGDSGQEYFSDGLTEEMITQLGRIDPQRLGVIARTSVMHYKRGQEQLERIGRELGVQYVLEGSVRRDSDKVRIGAQLIQVKDQTHLWAREYDRQLRNLLAVQGEIAQEIADEIRLTLGGEPKRNDTRRPFVSSTTRSYEAYDLYLKGRYFWNKRTAAGFWQAAEYFQQAIAKDPDYPQAYAGLADTYALISTWSQVRQNEFMPKARAAALKALQIDETLAQAHTSLALIAESYDYDWQAAEKEYQQAIQLDPNYATAHQWYAECLSFQGRFDEALAQSERARQLDPLSLIIAADHGAILYFSRQYDRAIEQFRTVLEMEPSFPRAHMVIGAYVQKGRFSDALAEIQNWRRIDDGPWTWAYETYVYGRWGRQAQARDAFRKLQELIRHWAGDPDLTSWMLAARVGMNRKDEAIALLEKAYLEHSSTLTVLKVEPIYDPLRDDPRFQELQRRVGLGR